MICQMVPLGNGKLVYCINVVPPAVDQLVYLGQRSFL